ncbi:hypothetical protein VPHK567_0033 [Vibrio phage K567]
MRNSDISLLLCLDMQFFIVYLDSRYTHRNKHT